MPWARTLSSGPSLQAQVVALEQNHSPAQLEVDEQQQLELQQEVGRLHSTSVQPKHAHRQRVPGLQEQVCGPALTREPGAGVSVDCGTGLARSSGV